MSIKKICFAISVSISFQINAQQQKPNVLFIICDDLNYIVQENNSALKVPTPGIDRLKKAGVQFTNAQANSPICAPSRASFLSGLYPQTTQFHWFDDWRQNAILKSSVLMPAYFKNNGYDVYGTGKINHNGQEDYSAYTKFSPQGNTMGLFGPSPWDGNPKKINVLLEHPGMSFMFAKVAPIIRWESTFGPLSNIPEYKADSLNHIPGYKGWILYKKPFKYINDENRDSMPDEQSAAFAMDVLKQKHEKPFFLTVGFVRPHTPMYAPEKYFKRFPLDKIQLPPHIKNDLADGAKVLTDTSLYGFQRFRQLQAAGGDKLWKKWIQAYMANVAFLDDQITKVLDQLDKSPYKKNTIIILTSDNGYHMGEKEYLYKETAWEESTHIPLIMVVPGVTTKSTKVNRVVSLIDIYPTLIDLCRLAAEPNENGNNYLLDGYSLKPLLIDPLNGIWKGPDAAITVIPGKDWTTADKLKGIQPPHYTIRTNDWRYILTANGEEELYDHKNDKYEWHNLAKNQTFASQKKLLSQQLQVLQHNQEHLKAAKNKNLK